MYLGKYRAKVVNIDDPEKRGRIRVKCPKVLGEALSAWCQPCISVASDNWGDLCVPPLGETVWIEFENGNTKTPIYTGGWYSVNKSPQTDYSKVGTERLITYRNNIIKMNESSLELTRGDVSVSLESNSINFKIGGTSFNFTSSKLIELSRILGG